MNGRTDILYYKGEPELERDICHIIPNLIFPHVGAVPSDYAERDKLAEYVFCGDLCRGGYFLTSKGKDWVRSIVQAEIKHYPNPTHEENTSVVCVYCRTARKATDKDGNPTTCKGCGATEARRI